MICLLCDLKYGSRLTGSFQVSWLAKVVLKVSVWQRKSDYLCSLLEKSLKFITVWLSVILERQSQTRAIRYAVCILIDQGAKSQVICQCRLNLYGWCLIVCERLIGYSYGSIFMTTACFKNAQQPSGKIATVHKEVNRLYAVDLHMQGTTSCSTLSELSTLDFLGIQKAEHT